MPLYAFEDHEPAIDPSAYVHPDAVVIGAVTLGPEASVWPAAVLRADFGRIEVGARTSIQDGTVLHTTEECPTSADCVVGHNAHLEGCVVEDGCLIGSGAVVLNRAVVRGGSVVGAAALVPEGAEVPSGHLALGVPARPRPSDPVRIQELIAMGVSEYLSVSARHWGSLRRLD
ncbi:gamma carbonic anhydrase family protein [Actinoplanes sp. NPDC051343]|uniref:gamma carbonic anhydrase family protein n=1 Tax=Actinoplanes sp. NPDC051343 TaxID=3363906 RepID=UPI0037B1F33F